MYDVPMPLTPRTLRLTFAVAAVLLLAVVAGSFFYARYRVRQAIREIPKKLGIEIQQTAQGFSFSKSVGDRTLFKISAAKTIQYKAGQRAELHDVTIIVYGKQANRFDQIYGTVFDYDPQAATFSAPGEVEIDLEGDASGLQHPDQAPPRELKNPIHLKTSGLVFNQTTGIAETRERIEFRTPQAHGEARGVRYDTSAATLTIESDIHIFAAAGTVPCPNPHGHGARAEPAAASAQKTSVTSTPPPDCVPPEVTAAHGVITKEPLAATLDEVRGQRGADTFSADHVRLLFRRDTTVESAVASGNVAAQRAGARPANFHAGEIELAMGAKNELRTAVLSGHPVFDAAGPKTTHGEAGRVQVDFLARNRVAHIRATENVKLAEKTPPSAGNRGARNSPATNGQRPATQDLQLAASTLDLNIRAGKFLERAWTTGPSQLTMVEPAAGPGAPTTTTASAARFDANFHPSNRPKMLHGAGDARIVSATPGEPERVTTSAELQVDFAPDGALATLQQWGDFHYQEGARSATAPSATYTASDQTFALSGGARYVDNSPSPVPGSPSGSATGMGESGGLTLAANTIRFSRRTGDVTAQGEVKTTYTDLKPAAGGALLGSGAPVHVTAQSLSASRQTGIARFLGGARLWQDANIVEAPLLEFDRQKRSLLARAVAAAGQPRVTTSFVQTDKSGKLTPVTVMAGQLSYSDLDRQAHLAGGVVLRGGDATVSAERADVTLLPRASAAAAAPGGAAPPSQLQQIVAQGQVRIETPKRHATGEKLVYTAADGKYVLTGGPPSIFDAEKGNLTGTSLTFFSRDDTVLVEGGTGRAVTQKRVTR